MKNKKAITATELARNLRSILDNLPRFGGSIAITRNKQHIASLVPGPIQMNALQALSDLYRTLPDFAATGWGAELKERRTLNLIDQVRDPWIKE